MLTENQRGHHYLEGLDLLAWGGCHLGLSLQLDSSDTTLLLRTGTGRAWNVSEWERTAQDLRSLEGGGRGACLWKASPHIGAFRVLDSSSWPQSGPHNTLLWLTVHIYNAVLLPRNRNSTTLLNMYVKYFYIFLGSQEQNQQVLKVWNYNKEFQVLLKLLKHHQGRTSHPTSFLSWGMPPRKKATKNHSVPEEGLTKTHFLRRLQEAASASADWGQGGG